MTYLAVMDPPWNADAGGGGRGAQNHYNLSSPLKVAEVIVGSGLWKHDGPALVWMWATTRAVALKHAHQLADALNLSIVSGFVWDKAEDVWDEVLGVIEDAEGKGARDFVENQLRARGISSLFTPPRKMGLGQWQRTEHEHLLVCRRGALSVPVPADRQRSVIHAERGRHSAKPEEGWRIIETTSRSVVGDFDERVLERGHIGVEFFARTPRKDWLAFGDQLPEVQE